MHIASYLSLGGHLIHWADLEKLSCAMFLANVTGLVIAMLLLGRPSHSSNCKKIDDILYNYIM